MFQGYSYVAPSVIFSENTISSDLLKQSKELQPDNRQLLYASHFKVRLMEIGNITKINIIQLLTIESLNMM